MRKNTITGYSVYSQEVKKRTKVNTLTELYPALPNKKFEVIYADPPWDYGGKIQFDNSSKGVGKINLSKNIFVSSASLHYPTLKLHELMKLNVNKISAENAILFMWTTGPHLAQALELGKEWGFEFRTVAFVWDKMVHNPGQYTLSYCEQCLLFKKGKIPTPRGARNVKQLISAPNPLILKAKRERHSQKPFEVAEGIKRMFPSQKRIELFSRNPSNSRKDWTDWGFEF